MERPGSTGPGSTGPGSTEPGSTEQPVAVYEDAEGPEALADESALSQRKKTGWKAGKGKETLARVDEHETEQSVNA